MGILLLFLCQSLKKNYDFFDYVVIKESLLNAVWLGSQPVASACIVSCFVKNRIRALIMIRRAGPKLMS